MAHTLFIHDADGEFVEEVIVPEGGTVMADGRVIYEGGD